MENPMQEIDAASAKKRAESMRALVDSLETVIRGKRRFLEDLSVCAVSGGHVLIDDLPGTGKTTVAKALARALGASSASGATDDAALRAKKAGAKKAASAASTASARGKKASALRPASASFQRIQFTPDILPYDITGVDIFNPDSRGFDFKPGPIFANVILADEINRATPKSQSALLEAMAERQVTVGGTTRVLDHFFIVIATQNPVESEGTYPLPSAQLDRFMMRLSLGYPEGDSLVSVLRDNPGEKALASLQPVLGMDELATLRSSIDSVYADGKIYSALSGFARSSHEDGALELGLSPRALLMLLRASRARALLHGRAFVEGNDLVELAPALCAHRVRARDSRLDLGRHMAESCLAAVERAERESPAKQRP